MTGKTDRLKAELRKTRVVDKGYSEEDLLSTSSTLLNLALTGNDKGGWIKGRYFFFVGDSSSGKTFLALSSLAEASINPSFDHYRLIHNDVEGGALMDMRKYFGAKVADRLEVLHSETAEEFYYGLDDICKEGDPFVYVLDSQDALGTRHSEEKFQEQKKASRSKRAAPGDYGDGKAKLHSGRLRRIISELPKTGSILLIVNQTRDKLDAMPFGPQTTYSGGRALRFYSCAQVWTSTAGKLKRRVRNKERQVGINVKVAVKKNRLSGKEWTIEVPIYFSVGVDDIGSCVDWLVNEEHWEKKRTIDASKDFDDLNGHRDEIIRFIENENQEEKLRKIVADVWKDIEDACAIDRKKRYE